MEEANKVLDAAGAAICCALLDRMIADLRSAVGQRVPLDKWLIVTAKRQFDNFALMFAEGRADEMVEAKEPTYPVPVEIKYAGVRWMTDESLPLDVVRVEAGRRAYGLIINVGQ